jgi:hypothetical protein
MENLTEYHSSDQQRQAAEEIRESIRQMETIADEIKKAADQVIADENKRNNR